MPCTASAGLDAQKGTRMSLHAGDTSRRRRSAIALATAGLALAALTSSAQAATATRVFNFTAGEQMFVVPQGVNSIHAVVIAGSGGDTAAAQGGNGALVPVDIAVQPGEILYLEVGGTGADSSSLGGPGI